MPAPWAPTAEATVVSPRVLVSRCLLGDAVRYDGRDKRDARVLALSAQGLELVPVCPEVAAGLGVPRSPIRLVQVDPGGAIRALGVDDASFDPSDALRAQARACAALPGIAGAVLKARSPSCALDDAQLFDVSGQPLGQAAGLFAATLLACLPGLPVAVESSLDDAGPVRDFVAAVFRYARHRAAGSK